MLGQAMAQLKSAAPVRPLRQLETLAPSESAFAVEQNMQMQTKQLA